jgi:hypothetical protein
VIGGQSRKELESACTSHIRPMTRPLMGRSCDKRDSSFLEAPAPLPWCPMASSRCWSPPRDSNTASPGNSLAYLHLKQLRTIKNLVSYIVLRLLRWIGQSYVGRLDLHLLSSISFRFTAGDRSHALSKFLMCLCPRQSAWQDSNGISRNFGYESSHLRPLRGLV